MESGHGPWVLPLASPEAAPERVGGKAASLARLAAAGLPVPKGFVLTTEAYRAFVEENGLQELISALLGALDPPAPKEALSEQPTSVEQVAELIREAFARGEMPPELTRALLESYAALGEPPVAVRSSATAEDLPERSFAGQQETTLGVRGGPSLLDAVRRGWASLWTARAMSYRAHLGVPQKGALPEHIAMALIVQEMVPAEVSGVLFTANPTDGDRSELIIEMGRGLGEAMVSGMVTPQAMAVDRASLRMRLLSGESEPLLPEPLVRELCALALQVERQQKGQPQDLEWAMAKRKLWLLQARPITTLPPAPEEVRWDPPIPGTVWIRRQVVEHMPEPLSPLFEELYLQQGLERSVQTVMRALGMTQVIAHLLGRPFFTTVHGYAYMRAPDALPLRALPQLLRAMVTAPIWLFRRGVVYWRSEGHRYLQEVERYRALSPDRLSDEALLAAIRALAWADARYWFAAAMAIAAAKLSEWALERFLQLARAPAELRAGSLLRGLAPISAADAELDALAQTVRASETLRTLVASTPAERLPSALPDTEEGRSLRDALQGYLSRHGHQIYTLDFLAPTLEGEPLPVLIGLKDRVQGERPDAASRRAQLARERQRRIAQAERSFGLVRRWILRCLLRWASRLVPYREQALALVGRAWPTLRALALELGRRLAERGSLLQAEDVFFLRSDELRAAIEARSSGQGQPALAQRARSRRAQREARRRLQPPAAVPPTARFRIGPFSLEEREAMRRNPPDATTLRGFPVSAGRLIAPASVIRSPAEFAKMEPGTILVCPTTTPAWTPLLTQARGLVTDIGGVLAHGSIVAREYGIPAVMGTGNGSTRIQSGQLLALDGAAGTVTLLR